MPIRFFNLILIVISGLFTSCNNDDENDSSLNTELIGNWKLIEVYNDPGDGSGNFESVNSKKTIEFKTNGTLTANGELCNLNSDTNTTVNGTFSESNSTIITPNCSTLGFEQNGNELIISIPCDEPCLSKYKKI